MHACATSTLTLGRSYQANSPQCASLADELFREQRTQDSDVVLLILDRRDDLVTPTLQPVRPTELTRVATIRAQPPVLISPAVDVPGPHS